MTEPDEQIANLFGRSTEDDKLESFERSTLKILLRRMGMPKKRVDHYERDVAEGFGFDWFNGQGWGGDGRLFSTRCFNFDFELLFTNPKKSALIVHLQEFWLAQQLQQEDLLIFRVNGIGRVICLACGENTLLDLPKDVPSLMVPFRYPSDDGDVVDGQAIFMTFDDYCDTAITGEEIQE